ncbi:MAG TPA: glycosyltransferase family 4 protein [Anaerolineae bacterium]|nr:glycosyltransferase family 4 protein [Anaerolineae bacterium]
MNILVCNAQVPFIRGGAELQAEGLVDALRQAGHRAELVALPFKWYPKAEIFKSALAWRLLHLTQSNGMRIDRIITSKFPSYAAQHPHKIVWLVHQLRQAYDWYGTPQSDWTMQDRAVREQLFELDRRTLGEAVKRFTTSCNLADRLRKFNGLDAEVLNAPPRLAGQFRAGPYGDSILYLGRLDPSKRIDLFLHALARVKNARAIIAGTGNEADALQRLAYSLNIRDRVEFTGYVDDARVIELYANARAVFYAPVDEDYGYATIEAFMSARPVITTNDAGGVLEFVEDKINGLVAAPAPEAIADALSYVWSNPDQCRVWGETGRERVRDITWANVVERLTA